MSSIFGHSLVGWTVGVTMTRHRDAENSVNRGLWLGWLIGGAIAPDLDYLLPFLHPRAQAGLRVTHSLFFALLLPAMTLVYLRARGANWRQSVRSGAQLVLASLTHLSLDLLVGVTPLPILWPLSDHLFKLSFGILPSAGKISLFNYYFYRNLGIEMGVLVPLCGCVLMPKGRSLSIWRWSLWMVFVVISVYFMHWAYGLDR